MVAENEIDKPIAGISATKSVTPKRKITKSKVWVPLILIGLVIVYLVYQQTQALDQISPPEIGKDLPSVVPQKNLSETRTPKHPLRHTYREDLSEPEVSKMIKNHDFYSTDKRDWAKAWSNREGLGIENEYDLQSGDSVVFDATTDLYWQQGGSTESMKFAEVGAYIDKINKEKYGGYSDWRLPTLQEAMSLMEPKKANIDLHINSKFDTTQVWIWTGDKTPKSYIWYVDFEDGYCYNLMDSNGPYVRAVRSRNPTTVPFK